MDEIAAAVARHQNIVLQFSGGRDSMACLLLLRPWWDRVTVLWTNTGAQFPEIVELMDRVRAMVPRFVEVLTDQPASIAARGWPSDVVPIEQTEFGKWSVAEPIGVTVRSTWECCAENIWAPMHRRTLELGATLIVRGQRLEERYRAPFRSGQVLDSIEFLFPVETWSRADVEAYLIGEGFELPPHYRLTHSSLDCWSCTGFANEGVERGQYMREHHPELFETFVQATRAIGEHVERQYEPMRRVIALQKE